MLPHFSYYFSLAELEIVGVLGTDFSGLSKMPPPFLYAVKFSKTVAS